MTKQFPLRVLLTVTTGRLLTQKKGPRDNGIGDLYKILAWMTGDSPFTHQMSRIGAECSSWLLRWFPELSAANPADLDVLLAEKPAEEAVEEWLVGLKAKGMKDVYDVPRIPADDHVRKHPYDELVEMRGSDEGIEIVGPDQ